MLARMREGSLFFRAALAPFVVVVTAGGCASSFEVRYVGARQPVTWAPEELAVIESDEAEPESPVHGVVTVSCATRDGTSGIFAERCDEAQLLTRAREVASEVGGTTLFAPRCQTTQLARSIERAPSGGATLSQHVRLTCQASVLKR